MISEAVSTPADSRRFLFPDGLRGVAAMMVVLFHFHENLAPAVSGWLPHGVSVLMRNGYLGVPIFFVLSGFVIAHSVRTGERSLAYVGRFALRRSIRLDPPLWLTIAIEVCLIKVSLLAFPELGTPMPTWGQLLANITYTQHFVGSSDIIPVFWSLTYEVQFYMVLVGALVLLHRLRVSSRIALAVFIVAYLYSLAVWLKLLATPLDGLFVDRWFQFAMGIGAWAVVTRRIPALPFALLSLFTLGCALAIDAGELRVFATVMSFLTAFSLAFVGHIGRMDRVLAGPVAQFLGKISYSLYLIHLSTGWRFISLVKKQFGPELGPLVASLTLAGGIAVSILSAWMMYKVIEAPSIRLARRVRLPQTTHSG